jgi:hypothetical protein
MRFKLCWRQVAQGRMNTLVLIDVVEEVADAVVGRVNVGIVMECDFLFLHGAHEAFSIPIFSRLTDSGHTATVAILLWTPRTCHVWTYAVAAYWTPWSE